MKRFSLLIYSLLIVQIIFADNSENGIKSSYFSKGGYVTIKGEIRNFYKVDSEHRLLEIFINDLINMDQTIYNVSVDTTGKIFFSLYIDNPQVIYLHYKNRSSDFLVSPGDSLFIEFDANYFPDDIKIEGKNSIITKQFVQYEKLLNENVNANANVLVNLFDLDYKTFKHLRDSMYFFRKAFDQKLIDSLKFSSVITNLIKAKEELGYYTDLISYAQNEYFNALKHKAQNIPSISLLDTSYIAYIDTFQIRPIYFPLSEFSSFINFSSLYLDLYSQKYNIKILNNDSEKKPNIKPSLRDWLKKSFWNNYLKVLNNLKDSTLKDLYVTQMVSFQLLKGHNINIANDSIYNLISDDIIREKFKNFIDSKTSKKISIEFTNNFDTGDKVIIDLKKKYPNKVLYIDFWAIGCSPCYYEMKKSKELKILLNTKDIIFVYICCYSEKDKWEKTISQMDIDGEHIFLNDAQYISLSKRFDLAGFPHYVIINRNGTIADDNAPRPSFKETLVKLKTFISTLTD